MRKGLSLSCLYALLLMALTRLKKGKQLFEEILIKLPISVHVCGCACAGYPFVVGGAQAPYKTERIRAYDTFRPC